MRVYAIALLLAASVQAALAGNAGYALRTRTSIIGNDINCGQTDYNGKQQSFCRISGGVTAVADACDANPACKSFVMEGSYSGYLKTGGNPVYTEGFNTFCRIGTKGCSGSFVMLRRTDVKASDINCNYKDYNNKVQNYCKVSGDLSAQIAACNDNPKCKSVTVENDYSGYLKTAKPVTPPVYREGWVTYVKNN